MTNVYHDQEGKTVAYGIESIFKPAMILKNYRDHLKLLAHHNVVTRTGEDDNYPPFISLMHRPGIDQLMKHLDGVVPIQDSDLEYEISSRYTEIDSRIRGELKTTLETMQTMIPGFCRARMMAIPYRTCYSMHKDATLRVHLPIQTNEKAVMIMRDVIPMHYPADGTIWHVDARREHTFVNGSPHPATRLHIMAIVDPSVEESYRKEDL